MPPCAHTECERFTGTMENRSTFAPISAILMTAESPARPPPMTMIFGAAAIVSLPAFRIRYGLGRFHGCGVWSGRLLRARPERSKAGESRAGQDKEESETHDQKSLPRPISGNDAPLRREQPDAIREVPRSRDQAHNIKQKEWSLKHFGLHLAERCARICVQINSGKPHRPGVPDDVGEGDAAGPALRRVHPISGPGIVNRVALAAVPDVKTVERVERDGQRDSEQLKEGNQRKVGQKAYLAGIGVGAADRGGVRNQNMFEQKRAHRNYARKRMQAPQNK